MSERIVNIFAAFTSALLLFLYGLYTVTPGQPFDLNFSFAPLVILGITYTLLAIHQLLVVRYDQLKPFVHPVPWKWVVATKYASFAILVWWVLVDWFVMMPFEPELRRFVWLIAALVHVWFLRRFVMWNRPKETKNARDVRQEATDIRQDVRDVTQDDTERVQRQTARDQREVAREQEEQA